MTESTQTRPQFPPATAFEKTVNGKQTHLYILKNNNGVEAAITNYGGRVVSLFVPDKYGKSIDIVLGFESVDGFINSKEPYYGATIGRFANRIAKGKFTLEGTEYTLALNNGPNTLHGGTPAFQDVIWDAEQTDEATLVLTYLSEDMEGGFPGNLSVKVTYQITDDNAMKVSFLATTDKTTVVNLTNHAFFNLNGEGSGTILNHMVQIDAEGYTPVNSTLIPTGKIEPVAGTPFDFTQPVTIGERINNDHIQLLEGRGYDHNYVLNPHDLSTPVATVIGDKSGIKMEIFTEEPGMQFYTGNFMQAQNVMKGGKKDEYRTSFAMETQHYPDSPNQPEFPSTVLKPGETYQTQTIFKFSVAE
ncbi:MULTISPECIES: aldose epimerase family protein [unclassified Mucilaginibacter]|uniref:aldose epimerase family protein n=1 Tax=unclassified Mucilaginibacter TaxID=2617802 RepID=UPI0009608D2B|nr:MULTISPECIES: aldose epimerase family protein [unclassified Mucilaginibacter]HEK19269.1 galactose mutarotase [Bacteroidota bacterium]OJW18456.1 MAG: galactose mutarotase [Mucilaginibacter sp. 44-25]PLW89894.1 MAG: galactose-1-epimerase [Mucilaginibacter sp.]PMP65598.1 MAG: galactose-1-epimerase [Mucilaginibacter sp.]PMP65888.1 MAG: galactose-1-epimerase [Mucilaginibacter sp.]